MAKYLLLSDVHLRSKTPIGRTDKDFLETQLKKFMQIYEIAKRKKVAAIIQAGDLFDSPNPSYNLVSKFSDILLLLKKSGIEFLTIPGQHDLLMRSKDIDKTAFGILHKAGLFTALNKVENKKGLYFKDDYICGFDFGVDKKTLKSINNEIVTGKMILVIHDMIGDKPLYPGQDIISAKSFLLKNKNFDIILCGDYHYPYHFKTKSGRHIFNTGCLVRLTRAKRDREQLPHVWFIDTSGDDILTDKIYLEDFEENPFIEKIDSVVTDDFSLMEFINNLRTENKVGISYLDNLDIYYERYSVSKNVKKLINDTLGE